MMFLRFLVNEIALLILIIVSNVVFIGTWKEAIVVCVVALSQDCLEGVKITRSQDVGLRAGVRTGTNLHMKLFIVRAVCTFRSCTL